MSRNSRRLIGLLRDRPHAIGAEVGVFRGDTSMGLLEGLPGLRKLICVDLWQEDEEFKKHCPNKRGPIYNAHWASVRAHFKRTVLDVYGDRVRTLQMASTFAADLLPNRGLDFAFIDGNHGYKYVREDIKAWWPKVKVGGLIVGDDYLNKPTYGVIQAVQELFNRAHKRRGHVWWALKTEEALI